MSVIDAHTHIGTCVPLFDGDNPAAALVAAWDRSGVECGVMSATGGRSMAEINDHAVEAAEKYPGRIYPRIRLEPADLDAAIAELDRCVQTGLFCSVKLHPSDNAFYPFQRHWFPLYERIQELGLPILMHSGTYPHSGPLAIAAAAQEFPGIPWILGHAGLADLTWEIAPAARLSPNVHVDTALNATLPPLVEFVEEFGAERMLWGSDWPFGGMRAELAKIDDFQQLGLSQTQCQLIAGGNAARIFGIE